MLPPERLKSAVEFRIKSDDSMKSSRCNYTDGNYRSVCARAWYAVYHAISAAAYARLKQEPPGVEGSWHHDAAESLFSNFLRASQIRLRHGYLIECLRSMRQARLAVDYWRDTPRVEQIATEPQARASIMTAERVRQVIWEVMEWPLPNQPIKSEPPS